MGNYEVKPKYDNAMRKLEPTDPIHADLFNTMFLQLLNNDESIMNGIYEKVTYVSDMDWISSSSEWGTVNRDKSVEGNPIRLLNKDRTITTFKKGIGTHAKSQVMISVAAGEYDYFEAYIGIDQEIAETQTNVPVNFRLYYKTSPQDSWVKLYTRTRETEFNMTKAVSAYRITVPIPENAVEICLEVLSTDTNSIEGCHADWADAKFVKRRIAPKDSLLNLIYDLEMGKSDRMHNHQVVNGHTIEANVPANAVFTDTWRPVVNNLESESEESSLSAMQGKILKGMIDKIFDDIGEVIECTKSNNPIWFKDYNGYATAHYYHNTMRDRYCASIDVTAGNRYSVQVSSCNGLKEDVGVMCDILLCHTGEDVVTMFLDAYSGLGGTIEGTTIGELTNYSFVIPAGCNKMIVSTSDYISVRKYRF